ncbi:cytochrome P450 [Phaeosphaeriaceae sp. SRC1lsM3a]|nr:cytochrome P450 [Stagonospora sp. SRC1lsM3a]
MAFVHVLFLFVAVIAGNWLYGIYSNYLTARKTGLRIIFSPITPFQLLWHVLPSFIPSFLKRQRWFRALDQGSSWQDKNKVHEELGSSYIMVSPGMNMLCTSDPVALNHVYKNMKDFIKPEVFKNLDMFGPNIITVNDEPWMRHRKLTSPCFNERISAFVWEESLRQAKDMLEDWLAKPDGKSNTVINDSGIIALHVITAASFGEQRDFREDSSVLAKNHKLSFRDALRTVLRSPVLAATVAGMPWLKKSFLEAILPNDVRGVQLALAEFRSYMNEAIARERAGENTSVLNRPNLLNALVKASDEVKAEEGTKSSAYMSDDELTGNMFMFAFAGHETTATTISYALALLAIHPSAQDWVAEELAEVMTSVDSTDYAKIYPKLKRTLAVMYETVRLYGVPPPWRDVACKDPQILLTSAKQGSDGAPTYLPVPANTQVSLNVFACHTAPENFVDAEKWEPSRWIQREKEEQLVTGNKAFFGWGTGPRVCPGQKFAQVEFVAVLATLLMKYKVVPAAKEEVSEDIARDEMQKLIAGSTARMVVNLSEPEKLWIKLVKR